MKMKRLNKLASEFAKRWRNRASARIIIGLAVIFTVVFRNVLKRDRERAEPTK